MRLLLSVLLLLWSSTTEAALLPTDEWPLPPSCTPYNPPEDEEPIQPFTDLYADGEGLSDGGAGACAGWNACPCEEDCRQKKIAACEATR